jgi:hypothetical protein
MLSIITALLQRIGLFTKQSMVVKPQNKNLTTLKQPVQKVIKILFQKKLCMADRHDQQLEREAVQGMRAKLGLQFH